MVTLMTNYNDSVVCDDDYDNDGDDVRHRPLVRRFHGPPPCWTGGGGQSGEPERHSEGQWRWLIIMIIMLTNYDNRIC